jgi:hypothetical protein
VALKARGAAAVRRALAAARGLEPIKRNPISEGSRRKEKWGWALGDRGCRSATAAMLLLGDAVPAACRATVGAGHALIGLARGAQTCSDGAVGGLGGADAGAEAATLWLWAPGKWALGAVAEAGRGVDLDLVLVLCRCGLCCLCSL